MEETAGLANSDGDAVVEKLRKIPSVNENVAEALWSTGIRSVEDLRGRDAMAMYEESRNRKGSYCEPCMLNTLRIAIGYVSKNK